jgi:hypothetical protein
VDFADLFSVNGTRIARISRDADFADLFSVSGTRIADLLFTDADPADRHLVKRDADYTDLVLVAVARLWDSQTSFHSYWDAALPDHVLTSTQQAQGATGLLGHSRGPHRSPRQKPGRKQRNELLRLHQIRRVSRHSTKCCVATVNLGWPSDVGGGVSPQRLAPLTRLPFSSAFSKKCRSPFSACKPTVAAQRRIRSRHRATGN